MSGKITRESIIDEKGIRDAFVSTAENLQVFIDGIKKAADEAVRLNQALKESSGLKDIVKTTKEVTENTKKFTREETKLTEEVKKTNKILTEKEKIEKKLKASSEQLRLAKSKENKELQQNRQRISEINKEHKDQVRTGSGFLGVLKRLGRSIGLYAAALFGLTKIVQFFTRDLLKMTAKLDALDYSMKTVIKSQEEYAQSQLFLSETAVNYGQDILTLTERYIKFRAATQQSNMSVQDTQKIFNSAAKAAAVLGLKTDEVNGVFLALEQMVSKGKVTTEELRRQLGERLPGAFGIMADAMGVSIRELDRMLKGGEVLSSEALPKFAEALEDAYGVKSVKRINTLAASQGRLKTSWVEFIDELNSSKTYIGILNILEQAMNRFRNSIMTTMSDYEYLIRKQGKYSDRLRETVGVFDEFSLDRVMKEQYRWVKSLGENTVLAKDYMIGLFDEYIERRKLIERQNRGSSQFVLFDTDTYKKELDQVKKDIESLANIENSELAQSIIESNKYLTDRSTTYKEVLELQEQELDRQRKLAEINAQNYEDLSTRRDLSEEENKAYEYWSNRAIALTEAQIEVNNRLNESKGEKQAKDDSLKLMQERQKAELEQTRSYQEELLRTQEYSEDDLARIRFDNNRELLRQELDGMEKQLEIVERGSVEEARLLTQRAKLEADLSKDLTDFLIDEGKRRQREAERQTEEEMKERERISQELLANAEQNTHEEYLDLLDAANKEIKASKGKADELRRIDDKLTLDLIQNEIKQLDVAIGSMDKETKAYEQAVHRRKMLKEQEGEQINRIEGRTQQENVELKEATIAKSGELLIEGFNLANSVYDAQLTSLEQYYKSEIAAAGDSVERRIIAERKYEREKAKLLQRQATAQKAQSAFSIILSTAEAIMAAWATFPASAIALTAIISAMGAMQLGAVMATPIPQFAKGTKGAPETFIAGEKGTEAIIKPSGDVVVTPDKPTLFSDKSFIGSTILPYDETHGYVRY